MSQMPPTSLCRSKIVKAMPCCFSALPAASPDGPAPITATLKPLMPALPIGPLPVPRKCSRPEKCPPARCSRDSRRRRNRPPRPPHKAPARARHPRPARARQGRSRCRPAILRVRMCSRTAISGPFAGIEDPVRLGRADQPVADVTARLPDAHHLRILDEGIVELAVARLDLRLQLVEVDAVFAA